MKTLVVANQKGGVGKTSTLVHIAFDFYERGLKVVVVDLCVQGNASYTLSEFASGFSASQLFSDTDIETKAFFSKVSEVSSPYMQVISADSALVDIATNDPSEMMRNFSLNHQALDASGFDVMLVDTGPNFGVVMLSALHASDSVLSPIEIEAYSIQGVSTMINTILNVRSKNTKMKFLGMLPSKFNKENPLQASNLEMLRENFPDLVIPHTIGLRSSISAALAARQPVWSNKQAWYVAREMREMIAYVYNAMGLES